MHWETAPLSSWIQQSPLAAKSTQTKTYYLIELKMKVKMDLDTRISRTRKSQVNLIGVETSVDFTIFMKHNVLELKKKAKEVLGCQEIFDVF